MSRKKSNPVIIVMAITALVVAPLVLFGVYLGFYVGGVVGYSKSILAIAFSTIGFLAAIVILSKAIVKMVARGEAKS
ncbi:MAG: hypothetical protein LYZ66_03780 [Nitrososphaerales archaeon]|nr:hypothetical protein [Nitrososphaerales archaeon]